MKLRWMFVALGLIVAAWLAPVVASEPLLRDGDYVAIIGDSITNGATAALDDRFGLLGLDDAQKTVLLIFSAMPTASSCYVLAVRMGYDGAYAAGLVTLSTLLGMASLPFALGVLRNL